MALRQIKAGLEHFGSHLTPTPFTTTAFTTIVYRLATLLNKVFDG